MFLFLRKKIDADEFLHPHQKLYSRKQPLIPFFRISKIEGVKKIIQAENKQPIKEISHQDIYALYDIWEQLQVAYPSYKQFFHELTCATSLAFYERYPSASYLINVSEEELGTFLRIPSHNTCSTNRARKILDLVAQEQQKTVDYQQERDCLVRSIAQQIRFILRENSTIEKLETKMYRTLGYQLETIPGGNIVTACSLVAHIGDIH